MLDRLLEHRDDIRGASAPALFVFARGLEPSLERRAEAGEVTLVSVVDLYR